MPYCRRPDVTGKIRRLTRALIVSGMYIANADHMGCLMPTPSFPTRSETVEKREPKEDYFAAATHVGDGQGTDVILLQS